jgi:MFS family permease
LNPLSFFAVAVGTFIFAHDFVGAGIVLPAIQDDFSSSLGTIQWVITGFSIAIAMAVVPAGRLADVFGAGRVFAAGTLAFAATSALVAIAPEMWFLLAARSLEGLAAGFVWISAVTLMFAHFGPARAGLAGGAVMVIAGLGSALGPIDVGLLIEWIGWRAAYLYNVPLALFAGLVMLRHRSVVPPEADRSIDWTGLGILAACLVVLLVTLRYAPEWGWGSVGAIVGFLLAACLFTTFALQQRAWKFRALVPPDIAGNRAFGVTFVGESLLGASYFIALSFAPQVYTNILGADAIEAGLMQVPAMVGFSVGGALVGVIVTRFSPALTVPIAGAVAALGGLLLALMPDSPTYLDLLPGLLLMGLGSGSMFGSLLTTGLRVLPEERRGLASGLLYTSQLAGGAVVLAAATAVATEASGFLQGARSAFLFGVGVGAVGITVTVAGYGSKVRYAAREASGSSSR